MTITLKEQTPAVPCKVYRCTINVQSTIHCKDSDDVKFFQNVTGRMSFLSWAQREEHGRASVDFTMPCGLPLNVLEKCQTAGNL